MRIYVAGVFHSYVDFFEKPCSVRKPTKSTGDKMGTRRQQPPYNNLIINYNPGMMLRTHQLMVLIGGGGGGVL